MRNGGMIISVNCDLRTVGMEETVPVLKQYEGICAEKLRKYMNILKYYSRFLHIIQ
jgi:hypothetical protein